MTVRKCGAAASFHIVSLLAVYYDRHETVFYDRHETVFLPRKEIGRSLKVYSWYGY
jgi:hypothetical protein